MFKKLWVLCCGLLSVTVHAEEVHVGVVFNSLEPLNEIIRLFEKNTSDKIIIHHDGYSTKLLYQQIKEKNDLDIVLMGDVKTATQLIDEGLVSSTTRFTYVFGKVVLWSKDPTLVDSKGEILSSDKFKSLAFADPKTAPYGVAAQQVLTKLNLLEKLTPKIQTFADSGIVKKQLLDNKVDIVFLPLSVLNPSKKIEGSVWIVPKNYYTPIEQQVVLVRKAENNAAAKSFFNYLKLPQARNIFEKYGFSVP
jgi:molybdate transport system substrate-binding protein